LILAASYPGAQLSPSLNTRSIEAERRIRASVHEVVQLPVLRTHQTIQNNHEHTGPREAGMLWTLFIILLVLWLIGVVSSYTLGGFIHILLVLAVVALLFQLITGRTTA
jgi:hypothetical protein